MKSQRLFSAAAFAALVAAAGCGGAGDGTQSIERDTVVQTIPRQDTVTVERSVEVEVDTIRDTRP
jgi:hypothetical protein